MSSLTFLKIVIIHNLPVFNFYSFPPDRRFLIANAQVKHKPIIYCNDAFCDLTKYKRAEMMQKPCDCEFLYGQMTSNLSKTQINQALSRTEETQVVVLLYKKDGTNFLCNVLIAPVKNEKSEVILFILNFDELNETQDGRFSQGVKRNRLLQQIGMPFISTIFARAPLPNKQMDSFGYSSSTNNNSNEQDILEQMPLNQPNLLKSLILILDFDYDFNLIK
jgi:PAS domain S-box-containing protein